MVIDSEVPPQSPTLLASVDPAHRSSLVIATTYSITVIKLHRISDRGGRKDDCRGEEVFRQISKAT